MKMYPVWYSFKLPFIKRPGKAWVVGGAFKSSLQNSTLGPQDSHQPRSNSILIFSMGHPIKGSGNLLSKPM